MALQDPQSGALTRSERDPAHLPTRRGVLVGLAAVAGAVAAGGLTAPPVRAATTTRAVTLDEFMELSDILTDNEFSLRDEVGQQYLRALNTDPAHAQTLRVLVNGTVRVKRRPRTFDEVRRSGVLNDDAVAETARQILVHWYSGLVNGRTADYLEALAWETLPFAEPASTKIGFSKWDDVP